MKWRGDENIRCDFCDKPFDTTSKLDFHLKVCPNMSYELWLQGIRIIHPETDGYTCKHCRTGRFSSVLGASGHAFECARTLERAGLPLNVGSHSTARPKILPGSSSSVQQS